MDGKDIGRGIIIGILAYVIIGLAGFVFGIPIFPSVGFVFGPLVFALFFVMIVAFIVALAPVFLK